MAQVKKGEAYYPKPGSHAELAVAALRLVGRVLSAAELADMTGVPSTQLPSILHPARKAGMLSRPAIGSGRRQGWLYVGEPVPRTEDDSVDTAPMIRRVVSAATATPLWSANVRAVRSVFELGGC
ncbi:MAG: hypothetical protein WA086_01385 [Ideonella sp.]